MSVLLRVASVSFLVAAGCAVESVEETGLVEQEAGTSCPAWICGTSNSPEIDHKGMHELNVYGLRNTEGFFISRLEHINGYRYKINVSKAVLTATPTDGGPPLDNTAWNRRLSDLSIIVKYEDPSGVLAAGEYVLRFAAVGRVPYYAKPPGAPIVYSATYALQWDDSILPYGQKRAWKNICSNPPVDSQDSMGMDPHQVVVFEGDRIDAPSKRWTGLDSGWFNIGCATHALAKLHLSGHTQGAMNQTASMALPESHKFNTTTLERQAYLKMLVGDFCGDGTPFTVSGQLLNWADRKAWMKYATVSPAIEARWDHKGPICLEEPRGDANPSPAVTTAFPHGVEHAIANHVYADGTACVRPPRCSDLNIYAFSTHINSANP